MNKEIIRNDRVNEQYTRVRHESGCTVCLCPMKGFSSAYALFGAKYGSVDGVFKTKSDAVFTAVPAGIAHYLEHKLFENEDCDAFKLYAETGAQANAYTSFDKTAYLFSCSQKFDRNLEILLKFVQEPYFTDATVQKERGIIAQEIKMYDDEPGWRVFFNGLEAVYHENPVRVNIAGTVESISKIDKDLLYRCYNTFYNLNNMVLSVAGNFDPDEALEICGRLLKPSPDLGLETVIPEEPPGVREKTVREKLPCGVPLFQVAFKMPNGYSFVGENYTHYNILLETAFGKSSKFYLDAYESGLINETFNVSVFNGRGFFLCVADGEAREPEKVFDALKNEIKRLKKEGLPEEDFNSVKKKTYGELVGSLASVEAVASGMMNAEFSGIENADMFSDIEAAANVAFSDITSKLAGFDEENSCVSIVEN
ncbi:MAG: insulinase family protein [Oscillospiraceae bacterium]|jgi:predicted Zn-dependent peptidase|nr:insulinase family protein [Oscillospiraceae bacterium]